MFVAMMKRLQYFFFFPACFSLFSMYTIYNIPAVMFSGTSRFQTICKYLLHNYQITSLVSIKKPYKESQTNQIYAHLSMNQELDKLSSHALFVYLPILISSGINVKQKRYPHLSTFQILKEVSIEMCVMLLSTQRWDYERKQVPNLAGNKSLGIIKNISSQETFLILLKYVFQGK